MIDESKKSGTQSPQLSEDFLRLYLPNHKQIYLFIATFLRESADVEEVLQETSIVLWKKYGEFQHDRDFKSWAFGIARLEVYRHIRSRKGLGTQFNEQLIDLLVDERERQQSLLDIRREALKLCLSKLSSRDRSLIEDCYRSKLYIKQVAKELNRSINAVYQSLFRIRCLLHECINRTLAAQEGEL